MTGPVYVSEIIDTLERVGCQFWACKGPDVEPEEMITCIVCRLERELKAGAAIVDDRAGAAGLTAEELAEGLGVSVDTLAYWRKKGTGPAYVEKNGEIFYPVSGTAPGPAK